MDIEKIAMNSGGALFYELNPDETEWRLTPKELQAYTNEIIELCAIACEKLKEQDYCVDVRGGAEAIRNLKG